MLECVHSSIHKSVAGSLKPRKITFPSYIILQFSLSNLTLNPASHSTQIPTRDVMVRLGTMCPVRVVGSPLIVTLQQCVDCTRLPSGRFIFSGLVATLLFATGISSMIKMAVAPVSSIAIDSELRCGFGGAPKSVRTVAANDQE